MSSTAHSLFRRFLIWRARNWSEDRFVLFLAVVVGILSGAVAVLLKNTVHAVGHFIREGRLHILHEHYGYAFPLLGILLTVWLLRNLIRAPLGDGVPATLLAISKRNGLIPAYKMWASILTSSVTVGFGGSVGLEGPTVSTGSAIGSNLARSMRLSYRSRILLISCATAGALSSILQTPIAALVFAIEVFSLDLTLASLVPLLLSSVSGTVMSLFFTGEGHLFPFEPTEAFQVNDLPWYGALGVLAALFSLYFNKVYFFVHDQFQRIENIWVRALVGGSLLGVLIYLIPPLYGEGYETINQLLSGRWDEVVKGWMFSEGVSSEWLLIALVLGLVLFKVVATSLTLGAGGVGGIFAPTLFMGSALGFVFARLINQTGIGSISESNFSLVGMGALLAGVLHAPLTAIFLIAEVTGGYELFLPLMLVCALSYAVVKAFVPHSVYARQLAQRGELITHDKDKAVLTLMKLDTVIESDFSPISPDMSLGDLVQVVAHSKRNLYPVLDAEQRLEGILLLDDFRQIMFEQNLYATTWVRDLMSAPPSIIQAEEPMSKVIERFQSSGAWNLPVIKDGVYMGFVSKSKLFTAYRKQLIDFSGQS